MPGPAKTSAKSTTGIRLSKAKAKKAKAPRLWNNPPSVEATVQFDQYMRQVVGFVNDLLERLNAAELKLNNMQVDPTTRTVTFPDT